jgi:hypothetical protein
MADMTHKSNISDRRPEETGLSEETWSTVNNAMHLQSPHTMGNLTSYTIISFSRRNQLQKLIH